MSLAVIVFIILVSVLLLVVGVGVTRASSSGPLISSFKAGDYCYPCSSPIDAQWGTTTFIAGWANKPRAQRRFVFWNNSGQTMTVRSFCFGGYHRKYGGQVTEMIADNLMKQYGYSNVINQGEVFSLDPENDAHVMYKGWYNSPIFIAYCLGNEGLKYEVVGWAPMRLQDEVNEYRYFYDANLKAKVKSDIKKLKIDGDDLLDTMDQKKTFKMARNAAIHWKSGSGYGGASPVKTISTNKDSQCYWVTELNTFDAVNVHVPLCHITVDFGRMTDYLKDVSNRAQCLRDIAAIASSKIMDSSADLDNFISPPDFDFGGLIADIVGISVFYILEASQVLALAVVAVINTIVPGSGFGLGMLVTALATFRKLLFVGGAQLAGLIPSVGDELQRFGMTAAGFGETTWVQETQRYSKLFFGLARGAVSAVGMNASQGFSAAVEPLIKNLVIESAIWGTFQAAGKGYDEYQKAANKMAEMVVEKTADKTQEILLTQITQLVPKAQFKGKGKDDWKMGNSGKDGYALQRKLWVNRELKKGKFAKDARCSGFWKIDYLDTTSSNGGGTNDCTIM